MSSNLLIAFFRSCTFLVVEPFQDGVLAKALLDAEYGFLHLAFLFERGLFFVPLSFKFLVVGEEVELDGRVVFACLRFFHDVVSGEVNSSNQ